MILLVNTKLVRFVWGNYEHFLFRIEINKIVKALKGNLAYSLPHGKASFIQLYSNYF